MTPATSHYDRGSLLVRKGNFTNTSFCVLVLAILTLAFSAATFFFLAPAQSASALTTVPTRMNFQGRLTDASGNIKPNGTYNMRLKLYAGSSGGATVWSEDRLVSAAQGVTVTNGLFAIQLGSISSLPASLFASGNLYLEVELPTPATATTSSPTWTEGPMSPRNQLATSAYAYNAETLDGLDSSAFGQLNTDNTWSGKQLFNQEVSINSPTSPFTVDADEVIFNLGVNGFHLYGDLMVAGSGMGGSSYFRTPTRVVQDAEVMAFSVSSAIGTELFSVDTLNSRVVIGRTTADATGTLLVLDTKNTAGDPTGVNGSMYYNSNADKFRCYEAGAWKDCDTSGSGGASLTANNTFTGYNTFRNASNSVNAFQMQNASGVSLLNADTTNMYVSVGATVNYYRYETAGGNLSGLTTRGVRLFNANTQVMEVNATDVNNDGKSDIISGQTGKISVTISSGSGFNDPVEYSAGSVYSIKTADLNGDGYKDIVTADDSNSTVSVFINNGNGTFAPRSSYSGYGPQIWAIAVKDFTGDNRPDIVATDNASTSSTSTPNIMLFINNGDGTFQNAVLIEKLNPAISSPPIAAGDFDGDGKQDMVISTYFYKGNGNGTFQPKVTAFSDSYYSYDIEVADFNSDGKLDMILPAINSHVVAIRMGNGNGTFQAPATYSFTYAAGVSVGDYNNDTKPDFAVTRNSGTDMGVFLNTGTGAFAAPTTYPAGTGLSRTPTISTGDFDSDGKQDLVVFNNQTSYVMGLVYMNTGGGVFVSKYTVGTSPSSVAAGDFNQDGKKDIVVTNQGSNNISVLLGDGSGLGVASAAYASGTGPNYVKAQDVNADGIQDLVVSNNGSASVSVLLGNGNGTFQTKVDYTTGTSPVTLDIADVNADGIQDLVVSNNGSASVSVLLGNGNGTFQTKVDYTTGTSPGKVYLYDYTGDGKLDIAVNNRGSASFSILKGNGDGTFQAKIDYATAAPNYMISADLNGDSYPDLATYYAAGSQLRIHLNKGDGTFKLDAFGPLTYTGGTWIDVADITGDGKPDLIFTNTTNNTVMLAQGKGNGSFKSPVSASTAYYGSNGPNFVLPTDINGDGKQDLVTSNGTDGSVSVLYNSYSIQTANPGLSAAAGSSTQPALVVQGVSTGQVADIFAVQNPNGSLLLTVSSTGNVCVNMGSGKCNNTLGVDGTIAASGSITANTTPDIAEYIPAAVDVEAADVVMADPDNEEMVVKAEGIYNGTALGVISDGTSSFMINPYGSLDGKNKRDDIQPLVLAGRVPVKISGENGPVKPGDYLTTSSTPGYAMKATKAGATIGKALGVFDGQTAADTGKVLVLVNISYYNGGVSALQGGNGAYSSLAVSGELTTQTLIVSGAATFNGTLSVNGHIVSGGDAPTVTVADTACVIATIEGNDTTGSIRLTTNTNCTPSGKILSVAFTKTYGKAPRVILSPSNDKAAKSGYYKGQATKDVFELFVASPLTAETEYVYDYMVIE